MDDRQRGKPQQGYKGKTWKDQVKREPQVHTQKGQGERELQHLKGKTEGQEKKGTQTQTDATQAGTTQICASKPEMNDAYVTQRHMRAL